MGSFGEKIISFVKNNDTNIITGIGIADGLVLGSYLWYRTGQKVQKIFINKENDIQRKLTFKEKVKNSWKLFLLPTANTLISGGLLIYSAKVGNKRLAALGAAYNLTEVAFQKYIDKTKEELGDKKATAIAQDISKDNIKEGNNNLLVLTGEGDSIFYEPLTDRYFKSNWTKIQKVANELNATAMSAFDGKISLTEWFSRLGLPKTDISDEMGWDVQKNGKNGIIDISIDAVLNNEDVPCGAIRYNTRPIYFE